MPSGSVLTARQHEVMLLLCDGLTYKQIAVRLSISSSTVRTHIEHAYRSLGVSNSHQAIVAVLGGHAEPVAEPGLSPWWLAYLHEFDRHLSGEPDAWGQMGVALGGAGMARRSGSHGHLRRRLLRAIVGSS